MCDWVIVEDRFRHVSSYLIDVPSSLMVALNSPLAGVWIVAVVSSRPLSLVVIVFLSLSAATNPATVIRNATPMTHRTPVRESIVASPLAVRCDQQM